MSTIPIRRGVQDLFYRYKMERIQTKVEGKGNGIKTVVVNLTSVAESLARPEDYIMKYFQLEVGATAKHDKDDRWKINGSHDAAKLQELLYDFIDKFVLCKKCQNPETDVSIKKDSILLDCKACGQRTAVDLRLKLSGYILKGQSKKSKSDKADRKAARKAKQNGTAKEGSGSGDDDDDDDDNNDSGDNANENGESKEGEDAELAALQAEAARLNVSEPTEVTWASDKTGVSKSVQLGEWIEEQGDAQGSIDKVDSDSIRSKVEELEISNETETPTVLAQAIFDENIVAQIPKRAELLKQVCTRSISFGIRPC
jgi:translation initiation factor 5